MPKLLDQVRKEIRVRFFSKRTEDTYVYWIRAFIRYHRNQHPRAMGSDEVRRFLSHLAVEKDVAVNTQKVALNSLVFLFDHVLHRSDIDFSGFRLATRPRKLPVVLSREELREIFRWLQGEERLCARLMYGSGLRVMEVVRLRIHDVDTERLSLLVRDGKGAKQRITTLAQGLLPELDDQRVLVRRLFDADGERPNWPGVHLPHALARKYANAPREWGW